jgi:RNA polymerase sigma factor FliA
MSVESVPPNDYLKQQTQETLVKSHVILVKRIAHHLSGRLPRSVQLDDLIQSGMVGLLEALMHYDDTKGAAFETYASIRIRGAMLDEVRRNDWVPRSVYRNARMISTAVQLLENKLGRDAKDQEIADELGIKLKEYHEMLSDSHGAHLYGFDDLGLEENDVQDPTLNGSGEPHVNIMRNDLRTHVAEIIETLPKNEKLVLSLYYEHDLNLKEIGDILSVTESRVSQIMSQATHRIKARIAVKSFEA